MSGAVDERRALIRTFVTTVQAVEDVHPHLRRITFAGGDLVDFAPLGPDTFLYVLLPPPGRTELTIDASFTWEQWAAMADDERPVGAYYTLRSWDPATTELTMLFVLHDPAGPASAWAATAAPGMPVALWGPREAFAPPADTEWYLLVVDDTGLPAAAVIVESLPGDVPVLLVAEVDGTAEQQPLPRRGGLDVIWVHRNGAPAGVDPDRLTAAVRRLELPSGAGYVWGGGESRAMTSVRRHVRDERGLPRERTSLIGYWRHASSGPDDPDD